MFLDGCGLELRPWVKQLAVVSISGCVEINHSDFAIDTHQYCATPERKKAALDITVPKPKKLVLNEQHVAVSQIIRMDTMIEKHSPTRDYGWQICTPPASDDEADLCFTPPVSDDDEFTDSENTYSNVDTLSPEAEKHKVYTNGTSAYSKWQFTSQKEKDSRCTTKAHARNMAMAMHHASETIIIS